jgi:hypothetical protein
MATMVPQPDAPNYWLDVLQAMFRHARSESCLALTELLLGGLLIVLGIYKGALRQKRTFKNNFSSSRSR